MTKNADENSKADTPAPKYFIVAGYGHVEAKDLSELEEKLKKLKEQEVGDGNS